MILEKIKLHPFAGIYNKEISFHSCLNIISGPNEAGKSTLIKALQFSLFVPSNIGRVRGQNMLKEYLPANGGDTISVDLVFSCDGMNYELKKKWGGSNSSELTISNGTVITAPETVQETLFMLLKNSEATWRRVLFANQAMLSQTINEIKNENTVINSFNDILRSAVMMQGGISSDKLLSELEVRIKDLTDRWNIAAGTPEISSKGQGVFDNPWKVGVGLILKSYYSICQCKSVIEDRKVYDKELDRLATEAEAVNSLVNELSAYIKANESVIKDLKNRQTLEAQFDLAKSNLEKLMEASIGWIKAEMENNAIENQKEPLNFEIDALEKEMNTCLNRSNADLKKQQLVRINMIQSGIDNLVIQGNEIMAIDEQVFNKAKGFNTKLVNTRIHLEAQKLKISILPNVSFSAEIISGIDETSNVSFSKEDPFETEANSRFVLKTKDFTIKVESGDDDVDTLTRGYQQTEELLNEILQQYQVVGMIELETQKQLFDQHQKKMTLKKQELEMALNGVELEQLKNEVVSIEQLPQTRDADTIKKMLDQKKALRVTSSNETDRQAKEIDRLKKTYESKEILEEKKLNEQLSIRDLESKIKVLQPLPDGVEFADVYIKDFEDKRALYEGERDKYSEIMIDKTRLESSEPEKTEVDLNEDLGRFKNEFNINIEQANAYIKIHNKLKSILEQSDTSAFDPYYQNINKYFSILTNNKYNSVQMEEILPESISGNGKTLGTELLSHGTTDSLALALRLSMADYFLKQDKGFIVLDDPLTDMDEDRRRYAATCLENYAVEKQVFLFTCHQSHADLFSGNKIILSN